MIASTTFSLIFVLLIINKASSVDLAGVKKALSKPLYDLSIVENQNSVPKVTVSIYYGSLCSDCADFFRNQIGPNIAKFQKYINVEFVPFGNAEKKLFEGKWFFKCQNGLKECMKNKWQACSIHILPSKLQLMTNYLMCDMNSTEGTGYQCTRKLGLYEDYYSKIKKCYMNKELSDLLMLYHSNRTRATVPRSTPMPVITFNGVYNKTEQDDAKFDLGRVICKYLHPMPAKIC